MIIEINKSIRNKNQIYKRFKYYIFFLYIIRFGIIYIFVNMKFVLFLSEFIYNSFLVFYY